MTIDSYIKELRMRITDKQDCDDYKNLVFEYIGFLENTLSENPATIELVCQLAIAYMEAGEPAEKSIELMENALKNESCISADDTVELLNNLAIFYAEEMNDPEKAKSILERAANIDSGYPNQYNALGILYLNENNIADALAMFEKAASLSDDIKYRNNYAAALYQASQTEKASDIFHEISEEWRNSKTAANALYSYGMIRSISGDTTAGLQAAGNLISILDSDICVDADKIAELYFICREFEKCIEMYDYENLYPSIDWMKFYFYSLLMTNSKDKLDEIFNSSILENESLILEVQNDNDEYWTDEKRKLYIENCRKDINNLTVLHDSIINKGYEPEIDFKPELVYGCWLIHCPRH